MGEKINVSHDNSDTGNEKVENEDNLKTLKKTFSKKPEDAGDALEIVLEHAGSMGRYQLWLFVAMLPFGLSLAFSYFVTIFAIAVPAHYWCNVPELEHLDLELRRNLTAPPSNASGVVPWDRCTTFDTDWSVVLETLQPPHPDTPTTDICPHGWVFEFKDIPYETVASQRGWVCQYDSYVPAVQAAFSAGALTGGLLFGWLADHYGRVPALVGANLVGFIGGMGCLFTSGLWDLFICRFIVGMAYDNCFMLVYILVLEYVGSRHRTWVANLSIMLYFGGGCIMLPWLAWWLSNWRTLILVTSLPMLCALGAPFFFPESARWLSSRNHQKRAVAVLSRLARTNGREIPKEVMDDFIALSRKNDTNGQSLRVVASYPSLRLLLVFLIVLYACCAIVFDGIVRLSGSLGMDMFVAFSVSSVTEFPSLLLVIFLLDRLGRRIMAGGCLALTGIFTLVAAFVEKGPGRAGLAISARFFLNMAFNTVIQWVAELLPSGARAAGSSFVHVTALLLSSVAPFIVYLERFWTGLPFVALGSTALLAAALSIVLPETKDQVMPHQCADAEWLILHHSLMGKFVCSSKTVEEHKKLETSHDETNANAIPVL